MVGASLERALQIHDRAARALLSAAEEVPDARWSEPIAEGKWSPAQILEHLIGTYDVVLKELGGGSGMEIRTAFWLRSLLRLTIAPKILLGYGFPKRAPAPREVRPREGVERGEGLARFRELAEQLKTAAKSARRGQQLTHAYFGRSSVANGVILVARHIDHHRAQIG